MKQQLENITVENKPTITKEDIVIEGVDRNSLSEKEWNDILRFVNIGYKCSKNKTWKITGEFIRKNEKGLDTEEIIKFSINKNISSGNKLTD